MVANHKKAYFVKNLKWLRATKKPLLIKNLKWLRTTKSLFFLKNLKWLRATKKPLLLKNLKWLRGTKCYLWYSDKFRAMQSRQTALKGKPRLCQMLRNSTVGRLNSLVRAHLSVLIKLRRVGHYNHVLCDCHQSLSEI